MKRIYDISDLLFERTEPTPIELSLQDLYSKASEEAAKLIGSSGPMAILTKTRELSGNYLVETGLDKIVRENEDYKDWKETAQLK